MNRLFKILTLLFVFLFFTNTYAYTKDDIISLGKSIYVCKSEEKKTFDDLLVSYTKLIEERNITSENINIIYNNLNTVINILNDNKVCSEKEIYSLPENIKLNLKELYNRTNTIIKSSPKIIDGSKEDINLVIDSENKSIKVYSGDVLKDVITTNNELNYVGMNKLLIITIYFFLLIFIISIIKSFIKRDIISISLIYVSIIFLSFIFVFNDEISILLDFMPNVNKSIITDTIIKNREIISYPSFGNSYGTLSINNSSEILFYGDEKYILSNGLGSSTSYNLPGFGKAIISGHNTGVLSELFNIENTIVIINTSYGIFKYKINERKIVDKQDLGSLEKDYDLVLYTCYPKTNLYGNERLIVYASLYESEWLE